MHDNLVPIVRKYLETKFLRPYADHSVEAFKAVLSFTGKRHCPMILDACCGVGASSKALSAMYPDHLIIGIDKSEKRLLKAQKLPENLILVRADLMDLYRMFVEHEFKFTRQYLLYPNPWPKSVHLKRRWHASPVFPSILSLGGELTVRSNWRTYVDEFEQALQVAGLCADVSLYEPDTFFTPFEKKYHESDQSLWQLTCSLG